MYSGIVVRLVYCLPKELEGLYILKLMIMENMMGAATFDTFANINDKFPLDDLLQNMKWINVINFILFLPSEHIILNLHGCNIHNDISIELMCSE